MTTRTDAFDLGALKLDSGEGSRVDLGLVIEPLELGGHTYAVAPVRSEELPAGNRANQISARLDISRLTGRGYALHLVFEAALHGPCMRCLEPAEPHFTVDVREVSQPGDEEGGDLESPYVSDAVLDVGAWARDTLVLTLPSALLCKPDCLGLCSTCGADLNTAGPEHVHESEPDPRWAVLTELKLAGSDAGAQAAPTRGY